MCYKDMTFCNYTDCKNFGPCPRSLTKAVEDGAAEWWGDTYAPIALFAEPPSCYEPQERSG